MVLCGRAKEIYNIYNATLQGGFFNPFSPYILDTIKPLTMDLQFGLGLGYKHFNVTYGQHLIIPEFQGAEIYSWGELNFSILF